MLKWKHLCKEKGLNTKGKTPKWFKDIEKKVLEDENGNLRKIKREYIGQVDKIKYILIISMKMKNKGKIV